VRARGLHADSPANELRRGFQGPSLTTTPRGAVHGFLQMYKPMCRRETWIWKTRDAATCRRSVGSSFTRRRCCAIVGLQGACHGGPLREPPRFDTGEGFERSVPARTTCLYSACEPRRRLLARLGQRLRPLATKSRDLLRDLEPHPRQLSERPSPAHPTIGFGIRAAGVPTARRETGDVHMSGRIV